MRPLWLTDRLVWELVLVGGLTTVAVFAGSAWAEKRHEAKADALIKQAAEFKGQAESLKLAASLSDRKVAEQQAAVNDADARVASAKRELASLRASLPKRFPLISANAGATGLEARSQHPGKPQGVETSEGDAASPDLVSQLQAQNDKKDEVIAAQDTEIGALKTQNAALTISRDDWKAAADRLEKQAAAQALASEEYRKAIGNGERRAGIKWGVAGVAVGFLLGGRR